MTGTMSSASVQTLARPVAPILVVEDDDDTRNALVVALEAEGYQVMTASHGLEALELLDGGTRPCLILLDLMMPIMDGVHFRLEQLERPPEVAEIPLIVISAYAQLTRAHWLRAADYLPKPIDFDSLLGMVEQHCRHSS